MKYLSVPEMEKKSKVSSIMIRRRAARGEIPGAQKVGDHWIIPEDADIHERSPGPRPKAQPDNPDEGA